MKSQNLLNNDFINDTFFIKQEKKVEGISYAVVRMDKKQLQTLIQCVDIITAKYRFRHSKLHKRLEYTLLPRLSEAKYITNINNIDMFGIEISEANQKDILLGLESFRIQRLLTERGIQFTEQLVIKIMLSKVKFTQFRSSNDS